MASWPLTTFVIASPHTPPARRNWAPALVPWHPRSPYPASLQSELLGTGLQQGFQDSEDLGWSKPVNLHEPPNPSDLFCGSGLQTVWPFRHERRNASTAGWEMAKRFHGWDPFGFPRTHLRFAWQALRGPISSCRVIWIVVLSLAVVMILPFSAAKCRKQVEQPLTDSPWMG